MREIVHESSDILSYMARKKGKPGMYLHVLIEEPTQKDLREAAPWMDEDLHAALILGRGEAYVFFDSREEMEWCYGQTVGPDGPTLHNPYNGLCRIYAVTADATGRLHSENT
jgi:hypothetical protein